MVKENRTNGNCRNKCENYPDCKPCGENNTGEYIPQYKRVGKGEYIKVLESEIPEFLYIIKSGHTAGHSEEHEIYYVIVETPYEPSQEMINMTRGEIKEKYNIIL